ncbi:ABC transporter substrate-binding protein [Nocardioides sp. LHG3406-4]|uniref:ABC transporter substrate-binding protein n=1 Tax=Nocardioides sp. LHG3406-4 TaxID=2804575 RepID=UPI003CF537CF
MRAGSRFSAVVVATALLLAGCGGAERNDSDGGLGNDGSAGGEPAAASACEGETVEATEIGVTEDTLTVTIGADTGSQAIPGMANGSVEAVQAWADLVNAEGGLACRQVEVRTYDTKIDPTESRNAMLDACQNSVAMVGSFMLAVADATAVADCVDKNGAKTGLPDIPAAILNPVHGCNATTFRAGPGSGDACPPKQGEREITQGLAFGEALESLVGKGASGGYMVANTSPVTIGSILPLWRTLQTVQGFTSDGEIGSKGTDTQSHYTPLIQDMKEAGSTFAITSATFPSMIVALKEAQAQGLEGVQWVCQTTCYDPAFPKAAGPAATGVVAMLNGLPYEEASTNEELQTFTEKVKTHNTFSQPSWVAARLFQKAVEDVVASGGPNAVTRESIIAALKAITEFDNDGMVAPFNPNDAATPATCVVAVQLQEDGSWKRAFPEEPGTFHCSDTTTITVDPVADFKG